MKLLACSVLLLAILRESYCKTASTINRTSTSWGYRYEVSDTQGFKVKHDDKGYHFEPTYNNTSSGLKKHYNSRTIYDHFALPGATNDSQSHSSTNDVDSTSSGTAQLSQGDIDPNKVLFNTSSGRGTTAESLIPLTTSHTVTVAETQTDTPVATYSTLPSASNIGGTPVTGKINLFPNDYSPLFINSFRVPTVPLYNPSYGPMYGPPTGPMYGPPTGPMYGPPTGPMYGPPTGPIYGPPTGPIYGPLNVPNYAPSTDSMDGAQNGQMYEPQNGQMYGPENGQMYGPENGQMYGPQNGQMYRPQNGQMYRPQNGESYRNY